MGKRTRTTPRSARRPGTSTRARAGTRTPRSRSTPLDAQVPRDRFEHASVAALEHLRNSLARLVESLPQETERAVDLRRLLDLDAALAWQIHTLVGSGDVLRTGRLVPKAGAMDRFFRAVQARRAPERLQASAREAYACFERVVAEHAGDREAFDAMLAALRPDDATALQRQRRTAYRANASVWGLSVRAAIHSVVFHQRSTGEHDCLALRGRVGVRRLREDASLAVYASGRTWGGPACPPEGAAPVSLDTCDLLEEYCSTPVPRVERVPAPDGTWRDFLRMEGLGRAHEVTAYWRNLALHFPGGSAEPPHGVTSPCTEPAEASVVDLLVPRGWSDPASVSVAISEHSPFIPWDSGGHGVRFPFEGHAEYLGTRPGVLHTRHAPRYAEIMQAQLDALGWSSTQFDIYRCTVAFPVLHSAIHLWVR